MSEKMNLKQAGGQYHFDPGAYLDNIRKEVPDYDAVQDEIARVVTSSVIEEFLDLGAGTGETALRVLARFPNAHATLVEEQETMAALLRERFEDKSVSVHQASFGNSFPDGPYCAAVSVFAVHHLPGVAKKELFQRIYAALKPGGTWAFGDVYIPDDPAKAVTPIDPTHDHPSRMEEVKEWLTEVGFRAEIVWQNNDLVVFACEK